QAARNYSTPGQPLRLPARPHVPANKPNAINRVVGDADELRLTGKRGILSIADRRRILAHWVLPWRASAPPYWLPAQKQTRPATADSSDCLHSSAGCAIPIGRCCRAFAVG